LFTLLFRAHQNVGGFLAVGIGQHDDSFWRLNVLPGNLARNGALHSARARITPMREARRKNGDAR
jgi:hypothetical protein